MNIDCVTQISHQDMNVLPQQGALWIDVLPPKPNPAGIKSKCRQGQFLPKEKDSNRYAKLVLASGSPSKVNVLGLLGLRFIVDPANIDESSINDESPENLVSRLALLKAQAVTERHKASLILGADTLIVDAGGAIGKPKGPTEARQVLQRLSGLTHRVITGITLVDQTTHSSISKLTTTTVTFRKISNETIDRYIATGEPLGKAGGYALQGVGALLVKSVHGEYSNVLGLPIATLVEALSVLGYELI